MVLQHVGKIPETLTHLANTRGGKFRPHESHCWVLSLQSVHSDIALTSISDYSDIKLKGSQSDIISEIGLTFLVMFNIQYPIFESGKFMW